MTPFIVQSMYAPNKSRPVLDLRERHARQAHESSSSESANDKRNQSKHAGHRAQVGGKNQARVYRWQVSGRGQDPAVVFARGGRRASRGENKVVSNSSQRGEVGRLAYQIQTSRQRAPDASQSEGIDASAPTCPFSGSPTDLNYP